MLIEMHFRSPSEMQKHMIEVNYFNFWCLLQEEMSILWCVYVMLPTSGSVKMLGKTRNFF